GTGGVEAGARATRGLKRKGKRRGQQRPGDDGHDEPAAPGFPRGHDPQARAADGVSWTTRPPTTVAHGQPVSVQPWNGEFRDFERKRATSTVARRSGSRRVISASAPILRVPFSSPRIRAGLSETSATSLLRSITPRRT